MDIKVSFEYSFDVRIDMGDLEANLYSIAEKAPFLGNLMIVEDPPQEKSKNIETDENDKNSS